MAQVSKWGNSLAVRIPNSVVKALDLKEGDELTMGVSEAGREFVAKKQEPEQSRDEIWEAIKALRKYRGLLPADFKFDRDEANGMDRFDKWDIDRSDETEQER